MGGGGRVDLVPSLLSLQREEQILREKVVGDNGRGRLCRAWGQYRAVESWWLLAGCWVFVTPPRHHFVLVMSWFDHHVV